MTKVQPRTPSGFGEYLPDQQIEFNRLVDIIRGTYEAYGFSPIDTPDMELSEVLLAKGGGETEKQIYRFEHGKNDLSLRFDLTIPLARYAAEHEHELVFPFRRYHIGKVHRAERAQAGRFREFYQCDIDILGSDSPLVDAEFPAIINEIFDQFNFGEFTIRLNNRMILNGFFEGLGLESSTDVLRIIDKMEKITDEEFVAELANIGLNSDQVNQVKNFTSIEGSNDEIIAQLQGLEVNSEQFNDGVSKIKVLIDALRTMDVPESRFKVDLKIARGLDYYTGTVYETILNDHPGLGSVCSGGRFDDLVSHYSNTEMSGVGISIGISRLFYKLLEAGVIKPSQKSPADVVVMPIGEEQVQFSLTVAAALRKEGIATMFYSEPNKVKKKFQYADRMGFGYVILIGDKEMETGEVSVKNMETGESSSVAVANLAQAIQH